MDIFDEYCEHKIKTIYQYSSLINEILAVENNKLWTNRKSRELLFYNVIKTYFYKYVHSKKVNINILETFFVNQQTINMNLNAEFMSIIEYFMDNKRVLDINKYEKEITMLAIIIHIANELDTATSPYTKNGANYNTIINNYISTYNKISFINIIDEGKRHLADLFELVKTNVRKERRIFDLLTNENSYNKYIAINSEKHYFLAQYYNDIPNIDKYDYTASRMIYVDSEYDSKFTFVSLDLIIISLVKIISCRAKIKEFFIPLSASFINNEKYLKDLAKLNNSLLKKYIRIFVNSDKITNHELVNLDKYFNDYYIYYRKETPKIKIDSRRKYIFNKEYYEKYWKVFNEILVPSNIIIEEFSSILAEKDILN